MRQFLSALPVDDDAYQISIGPTTDVVRRGGLVSPIFPAFGGDLNALDEATALLLCFPASPPQLLRYIQNELPKRHGPKTAMTYGLAAVLVAGDADELRGIAQATKPLLAAFELWPLETGRLSEAQVERYIRSPDEHGALVPICADGLPYDSACQVRQLNVSLQLAVYRASIYAPELVGAFTAIARAASDLVGDLREIADSDPTIDTVREHHYYLSRVLEVNAGLAMVISQTLGGVPPLLNSEYPVGEYALLGIGTAARALWSFYHHLRRCFALGNHANRLATNRMSVAPFEPFVHLDELDFAEWSDAPARLSALPAADQRDAAPHLLHYSSRFGFHETAYTLGASWQSLHASSSREWHLLTLTHEYIHSQVRHITAAIYPRETDWARLASLYNGERPQNAMESMQVALVLSMARYAAARNASAAVGTDWDVLEADGYVVNPTPAQLRELIADELRYLQEIVVHVLDFLYTFHGRPATYLAAIWQSWSTVPSVTERIHDYLLRSLCALSSDAAAPQTSAAEAFSLVFDVALDELRALAPDFGSPVVDAAVAYLERDIARERLEIEFSQAYYIARFTREFFFDETIATALRTDDQTVVGDAEGPAYVVQPGAYPDHPIASPLAFLSDRFSHEKKIAGPELEFASLWQLLLLAEPQTKDW